MTLLSTVSLCTEGGRNEWVNKMLDFFHCFFQPKIFEPVPSVTAVNPLCSNAKNQLNISGLSALQIDLKGFLLTVTASTQG